MDFAAIYGHLEVVKWLYYNHLSEGCTQNAMNWAASYRAMNYAALYGHLSVVKWLHYHRTDGCTRRAIEWAADNGHLEIVKWLTDNIMFLHGNKS
jgi:ankyrin repeat protein